MKTPSPSFNLRPAQESDAEAIRTLIQKVHINPMGLNWQRFTLAVDGTGEMIGCIQVKPHRDGSQELASLAVEPEWQGHSVGRALVQHVLSRHPGPLHLTCRASLGPYYEQFGFSTLSPDEMPAYFRRFYRLFNLLKALPLIDEGLLVMRRAAD